MAPLSTHKRASAAKTTTSPPAGWTALVTGGSGFLGRHLVDALLADGRYATVRVFDVRDGGDGRVTTIVGDLREPASIRAAVAGVDVVFHCATASPAAESAANRGLMTAVNVGGTRNVIEAVVAASVPRLVFTSSASVVFDGYVFFSKRESISVSLLTTFFTLSCLSRPIFFSRDLDGVNESAPYARRPMDYYAATKIEGEKLVLAAAGRALANGAGRLAVTALRPSGIFGEHDALLVPVAVAKARAGKMKYIIGLGGNLMDWTYAGNVAAAHVLADAALAARGPRAAPAGRPYFITNGDPRPFWVFMGDLLAGLGYGRPHIKLPFYPLFLIASLAAWVTAALRALGASIPPSDFTPARLRICAATRRLSCAAAGKDFGYHPHKLVSIEEGLKRTVAFFPHLRADAGGVTGAGGSGGGGQARAARAKGKKGGA